LRPDSPTRRLAAVKHLLESPKQDAHFLLGLETASIGFVAAVMAMIAEEERRMISRRTKDALAAAKRRGVKLGGYRAGSDRGSRIAAQGPQAEKGSYPRDSRGAHRKFKSLRRHKRRTHQWLETVVRRQPDLFVHWRLLYGRGRARQPGRVRH
jgi:DNA invertase Pin-like site-specific DNA recombinase